MSKVPDNFHKDFPARMSDGRFITNHHPICETNLMAQGNMTSWQYKLFLTRNSNEIMKSMNDAYHRVYGCDKCNDPSIPLENKYLQECVNESCHIKEVNPKGAGLY